MSSSTGEIQVARNYRQSLGPRQTPVNNSKVLASFIYGYWELPKHDFQELKTKKQQKTAYDLIKYLI